VSRILLLLWTLCLSLAACSDSSSTHVAIVVDNSIDDPDDRSGLIVAVVVRDDDESGPAPAPTSSALQGAVGAELPASARGGELAYLELSGDGRALGVTAGSSHWLGEDAAVEIAELTWSFDGASLLAVGRDRLLSARGSRTRTLLALEGASAADGGPALELDGEPAVEVIAAIGSGSGGLEDVFAIYLDAAGEALGAENLTRTPGVREIDAAWLHDGTRLAVLERTERDALAVRSVRFSTGDELPAHAELEPGRRLLWQADAGTLRGVSAARTRELLAVTAWTGRDWDVLCIDDRGEGVNLGAPDRDESSASWSRGDRWLAVEQRCATPACAPLPVALWRLDYPAGPARCPRVASSSPRERAGALPAWRP
jgi:hypothetical protein